VHIYIRLVGAAIMSSYSQKVIPRINITTALEKRVINTQAKKPIFRHGVTIKDLLLWY